jgi:two-component system phosphate regulon sensor histidine kinase PhoR
LAQNCNKKIIVWGEMIVHKYSKMAIPIQTVILLAAVVCGVIQQTVAAIVLIAVGIAFSIWVWILETHAATENHGRQEELAAKLADTETRLEECLEGMAVTRERSRNEILRFHSAVSHGLRIPISIIQGYAELLDGDLVTDEEVRREYLHKIVGRVKYMNDLLGQLLLEARAEADLPVILPARLDLLAMVRRMADDLSAAAAKLGIGVQVISGEEEICIEADQTHLTKAFYNILENSLKYMGRPGTIYVTVSRVGEKEVMLVFKDNGVGMPSEEAEHIFDMNCRVNKTVSGSGMGLHIAKMGVLAHGGTIFARCDTDKGVGVHIILPTEPRARDGAR